MNDIFMINIFNALYYTTCKAVLEKVEKNNCIILFVKMYQHTQNMSLFNKL